MSRKFYAKIRADINEEMARVILGKKKPTRRLILPKDAPCNSCISAETVGSSTCRQGGKNREPCGYWKDVIVPGLKDGTIKTEEI